MYTTDVLNEVNGFNHIGARRCVRNHLSDHITTSAIKKETYRLQWSAYDFGKRVPSLLSIQCRAFTLEHS